MRLRIFLDTQAGIVIFSSLKSLFPNIIAKGIQTFFCIGVFDKSIGFADITVKFFHAFMSTQCPIDLLTVDVGVRFRVIFRICDDLLNFGKEV